MAFFAGFRVGEKSAFLDRRAREISGFFVGENSRFSIGENSGLATIGEKSLLLDSKGF